MLLRILIQAMVGYYASKIVGRFLFEKRPLGRDEVTVFGQNRSYYDQFFPDNVENKNYTISKDTSIENTVNNMLAVIRKYAGQTKEITQLLQKESSKHFPFYQFVFFFVFGHIKYEKDHHRYEQIKTPLRLWKDGKGDCDCMATFIGSILYNANIPFYVRIAGYDKELGYEHVYIVTKDGCILDPVVEIFNYEKPPLFKKDYSI